MRIPHRHAWNVSPGEAVHIQHRLRSRLDFEHMLGRPSVVAGADLACSKGSTVVWAGMVIMSYPGMEILESRVLRGETHFPYVPGLLSFREIPMLLRVARTLRKEPDVILCDGQGIAHPRGMGLAAHLGVLLEKPTVGCAKSRLVGDFSEPGARKGDHSPLRYRGRTVGAVLRTRDGVRPLFVSPGNRVSIEGAVEIVLRCALGYRLPEPTRQAHLLVTRARRTDEEIAPR
jgi:deoxyribonuclease V